MTRRGWSVRLRRGIEWNTFTILARCPRSNALGVAIATYSLAVGSTCPAIKSGVGAMASQAYGDPRLRPLIMSLLESGSSPDEALSNVRDTDPHTDYRQIGIVDHRGRSAVYTGGKARHWAGHLVGEGWVVMGNSLVGKRVIEAMAHTFELRETENLEDRLLSVLESGGEAGGQPQGQRSAVLTVYREESYPWVDLRVDAHEEPVRELRRIYELYKPMIPYYYYMRPRDPENLPTQDEWLRQQRQDH